MENHSAIKRNLKKHYTKWKQQDTKDYLVCDSISVKNLEKVNL